MSFNEYNRDQLDALALIRDFFRNKPSYQKDHIAKMVQPYLDFRASVDDFHKKYLSDICTVKCFQEMQSACCNKEGIATFFADFAVNILYSEDADLDIMEEQLLRGASGNKCVYLTDSGCLWHHKPIVCEMFLCDHAKKSLGERGSSLLSKWAQLRKEEKKYTWPDKPVLFDKLEAMFLAEGIESTLMYFHKSPGLIRIKSKWKNNINIKSDQYFA